MDYFLSINQPFIFVVDSELWIPPDIIKQSIGVIPESEACAKKEWFPWQIVALREPSGARGVEVSRAGRRSQLNALRQHALPQRKHSRLQELIMSNSTVEEEEWVEVRRNNEPMLRRQN